mmetsp:Transcript_1760/g.5630  ORF Transcript_1760/g.5630 Transcript_1760/m.5630 type:complete len:383 (-) Transcript_1760:1962-3110(-)
MPRGGVRGVGVHALSRDQHRLQDKLHFVDMPHRAVARGVVRAVSRVPEQVDEVRPPAAGGIVQAVLDVHELNIATLHHKGVRRLHLLKVLHLGEGSAHVADGHHVAADPPLLHHAKALLQLGSHVTHDGPRRLAELLCKLLEEIRALGSVHLHVEHGCRLGLWHRLRRPQGANGRVGFHPDRPGHVHRVFRQTVQLLGGLVVLVLHLGKGCSVDLAVVGEHLLSTHDVFLDQRIALDGLALLFEKLLDNIRDRGNYSLVEPARHPQKGHYLGWPPPKRLDGAVAKFLQDFAHGVRVRERLEVLISVAKLDHVLVERGTGAGHFGVSGLGQIGHKVVQCGHPPGLCEKVSPRLYGSRSQSARKLLLQLVRAALQHARELVPTL